MNKKKRVDFFSFDLKSRCLIKKRSAKKATDFGIKNPELLSIVKRFYESVSAASLYSEELQDALLAANSSALSWTMRQLKLSKLEAKYTSGDGLVRVECISVLPEDLYIAEQETPRFDVFLTHKSNASSTATISMVMKDFERSAKSLTYDLVAKFGYANYPREKGGGGLFKMFIGDEYPNGLSTLGHHHSVL